MSGSSILNRQWRNWSRGNFNCSKLIVLRVLVIILTRNRISSQITKQTFHLSEIELKVEDACRVQNGGCGHVCRTIDEETVKCSCNEGYDLQADERTCIGEFWRKWQKFGQISPFTSQPSAFSLEDKSEARSPFEPILGQKTFIVQASKSNRIVAQGFVCLLLWRASARAEDSRWGLLLGSDSREPIRTTFSEKKKLLC